MDAVPRILSFGEKASASHDKSILEARELHSLLIARITLTFGICTGGVMSEVRRRLLYVDS